MTQSFKNEGRQSRPSTSIKPKLFGFFVSAALVFAFSSSWGGSIFAFCTTFLLSTTLVLTSLLSCSWGSSWGFSVSGVSSGSSQGQSGSTKGQGHQFVQHFLLSLIVA
jgi:hypothetical protein